MSEKEQSVLVLSPTTEKAPVAGSRQVTADCGHECWVSPGSAESFEREDVYTKCVPCAGGPEALMERLASGGFEIPDPQEVVTALFDIMKDEPGTIAAYNAKVVLRALAQRIEQERGHE